MVVRGKHPATWIDGGGGMLQLQKSFDVLVMFWILLPSSDFRFRSNGQLISVHHWRLGLSGVD